MDATGVVVGSMLIVRGHVTALNHDIISLVVCGGEVLHQMSFSVYHWH